MKGILSVKVGRVIALKEKKTLPFEILFEDDQIIVLLKNKKFIALNTNDDKVIEFLKSKILK